MKGVGGQCPCSLLYEGPISSICILFCSFEFLSNNMLTLSLPNFRRHLSSAFNFNKLSLGKKLICKDERLNVKQRRSR